MAISLILITWVLCSLTVFLIIFAVAAKGEREYYHYWPRDFMYFAAPWGVVLVLLGPATLAVLAAEAYNAHKHFQKLKG